MTHKTLKVEGMSCDHCVQTISKAVGDMTGINHVGVSLDKKEVVVDFEESQVDIKAISARIKEVGFEVAG